MHVVVVSDTHITRGSARRLPPLLWSAVEQADVILHAGDIMIGDVLDDLGRHAPVHAVLGNNDHALQGQLPETLTLHLDGVVVGMIHDSGPTRGRPARMRKRFPEADLVVFGHSHEPVNAPGVDGQWLLNPGSPTERRRQPHHTIATFDVVDAALVDPQIVVVSPP